MKLDQKYFAPFMLVGAIITAIFIVYASFHFKNEQESDFLNNTITYAGLLSDVHPQIEDTDSISLGEFEGKKAVVVFWASWSQKSAAIMDELDVLESSGEYKIVAALVMDATETASVMLPEHDFVYMDGTRLFNQLKVPGIPSYFLLDEAGKVVNVTVGYREGVVDRVLESFVQ